MKYYISINNDNLIGCGQYQQLTEGVENIEVTEDIYNSYNAEPEKYVFKNAQIVLNPNYDKYKAQKKKLMQIAEIKSELVNLDTQAIRPLRAILTSSETDDDKEILKKIETRANILRKNLSQLLEGKKEVENEIY